MSKLLQQSLLAAGFAMAACTLCLAPASAQTKPAASKKAAKAKAAKPAPEPVYTEPEPDITDTTTTEYDCELGNKITIYHNELDNEHIALRWKKRLHRLTRVGTTTGARRFENTTFGLIWIGIPSKGMLLDAKLNRQLANECKNKQQLAPPVIDVIEPAVAPVAAPAPAPAPAATAVPAPPAPVGEAPVESKTK